MGQRQMYLMGREFNLRYIGQLNSSQNASIGQILDFDFKPEDLSILAVSKNTTIQSAESFLMGFNNFGFSKAIGN